MNDNIYEETEAYLKQVMEGTEAREIRSLDEEWSFRAGDFPEAADPDFDDSSWRVLSIPHDYSVEAAFSEKHNANGFVQAGVVWYRKRFDLSRHTDGTKYYLMFDGVSMNSQVWVNGSFLGMHPYAFTPFWYDITPYVKPGSDNVIAVKADCSLQPFGRSYQGTGIFRNVWLTAAYPLHIEQWGVVAETTAIANGQAEIGIRTKVQVNRYPETVWNAFAWQGEGLGHNNHIVKNCTLVTSIIDQTGTIVAQDESVRSMPSFSKHEFKQKLLIRHPELWHPEQPHMYRVHSKLLADGKLVDDAITRSVYVRLHSTRLTVSP